MAITALNVAITTPETAGREQGKDERMSVSGILFADLFASLGHKVAPDASAIQELIKVSKPDSQPQTTQIAPTEDPLLSNVLAQIELQDGIISPLPAPSLTHSLAPKSSKAQTEEEKKKPSEKTDLINQDISILAGFLVQQQAPISNQELSASNNNSEHATTITAEAPDLARPETTPAPQATRVSSNTQLAENIPETKSMANTPVSQQGAESPSAPQSQDSTSPLQSFSSILQTQVDFSPQTSAVATGTISAPIQNQAAWSQQVGERVILMNNAGQKTAELHLNPTNLGPMQVTLSFNADQTTSALFVAHHPETRQAIQDALPQLREMFASAGISLGQANVSSQSQQQNNSAAYNDTPRSSRDNAILTGDSGQEIAARAIPLKRGNGLVDLFA